MNNIVFHQRVTLQHGLETVERSYQHMLLYVQYGFETPRWSYLELQVIPKDQNFDKYDSAFIFEVPPLDRVHIYIGMLVSAIYTSFILRVYPLKGGLGRWPVSMLL